MPSPSSSTYAGSGPEPSPAISAEQAPTIDDLFDTIERRLTAGIRTRAVYDPALGYPTEAFFDYGEEGDGFTAEELVPAPP